MGTQRTSEANPVGFAEVLRVRAFSVLFAAEVQSLVGDQLARVALSVLVFDRTGSVAATSATYAMTFLPSIVGGALLARIADRISRRAAMIGCDLVRAGAFAVLAMPGLPLWAVVALVVLAVLFEPVFSAAQVAYLADQLPDEQFRATSGLRMASHQIAQVAGFGVGGAIVAVIDPRGALAANAASFLLSAMLIAGLLPYGQDAAPSTPQPGPVRALVARTPSIWREQRMRLLLALMLLAGLFVVPEGLAVPLTVQLGDSTVVAGLLLASIPLGGALGALWLVRGVRPKRRESVSGLMAIACGVPLLVTVLLPPWPVVFATWLLSGAASAYQVEVITEIARSAPANRRSGVVGFASGALVTAQGVGLAVFGGVAQLLAPTAAIALAGGLGSALAVVVVTIRRRGYREVADDSGLSDSVVRPTPNSDGAPNGRTRDNMPTYRHRTANRPMPTPHRSVPAGRPRPERTQESV